MQALLPRYFKAPRFENYDATTNLVNHLENFKAMMLLHGATNAILL